MTTSNLLILDVDGVMTDGTKVYGPDGAVVAKRFCDHDFTAIKCFQQSGWVVVFLSADKTVNEALAKSRGIPFYYSRDDDGTIDKVKWYYAIREQYGIGPKDVIYVGDDLLDLAVMETVVVCGGRVYYPKNAVPQFRRIKHGTKLLAQELQQAGGYGAVMALYDLLYQQFVVPRH